MPIAWQRLTKYKLLLDNILASYKKHWDELDGTALDDEYCQCVSDMCVHIHVHVHCTCTLYMYTVYVHCICTCTLFFWVHVCVTDVYV